MDFALTKEQQELREAVIDLATRSLNIGAAERYDSREFYWEGWKKCADFGIHGMAIPKQYGGLEMDLLTCVVVMEGLGYASRDPGLLFSINSHVWTCEAPILTFGTEEQKKKYLCELANGSIVGGHAMTEPDSGSDAFSLRSEAKKVGNRYVLNGSKVFCTNAPIANVLLIFAKTGPGRGFGDISVFIVERGSPGLSFGKPIRTMGLRDCPLGEVVMQDCEVPAENLLGREGDGGTIFASEMEQERSCLFALHVGSMQRIEEDCVEYARTRKQFGKKLGSYQAISHKIADMRLRTEMARLALHRAAWLRSTGTRSPMASAVAKLYISEAYVQTCLDAVQIHGAYGYCEEQGIERSLRDAVGGKIYSGTSEIQRNIIARLMGLR